MRRAGPSLLVLLAVCVLSAAALGLAALLDVFPGVGVEAFFSALFLALYAGAALLGMRWLEGRARPIATRVMLGVATLGVVVTLGMIWSEDALARTLSDRVVDAMRGIMFSLWTASVYLLVLVPTLARDEGPILARVLRTVGVIVGSLGALGLVAMFLSETLGFGEVDLDTIVGQATIVCVIVGLACAALLPLVSRLGRTVEESGHESTIGERTPIRLTCPRCGSDETLRVGQSRCSSCGLRISVEFEEPRCGCGYLLYGLSGEHCPECGRPISESSRWADATRPPEPPDG